MIAVILVLDGILDMATDALACLSIKTGLRVETSPCFSDLGHLNDSSLPMATIT
jgi:hypothetical protein